MLRPLDIAMIAALIAAGSWTFKVKHDSEVAMERVAKLERQIAAEREAMDLLRADWSLLTSPDRLQALSRRHNAELNLTPIDPARVLDFDDIPFKPARTEPAASGFAGRVSPRLDTDLKSITGSVDAGEASAPARIEDLIGTGEDR